MRGPALAATTLLGPAVALAQEAAPLAGEVERAAVWLVVVTAAPLLAVAATAFAKAAVLLGLLRGGLGVPGALPAAVTTALAALLALLVMTPVAQQAGAAAGPLPPADGDWAAAVDRGWPPVQAFLVRHTDPDDAAAVRGATAQLDPQAAPSRAEGITAFLISELGAAFELGVLLLLPFLVVDLLVANTLTTVGFAGLPPPLVALPFKLLLFVAVDGWALFARGFIAGYSG
ncbi:MAG: EscR/YscR/HrcR family type III secretion system export apparatus protein [Myxococcales bacterium]|nr:EscR/YscR/HrcR family type III secretion system export apparatus protein [Myxococcales bacterium]